MVLSLDCFKGLYFSSWCDQIKQISQVFSPVSVHTVLFSDNQTLVPGHLLSEDHDKSLNFFQSAS